MKVYAARPAVFGDGSEHRLTLFAAQAAILLAHGCSREVAWSYKLLPPLTASTPDIEVAGLLEPAYAVGGDAFDYALGEDVARLAIFDAAGHSLLSGMVAAAAVAAYRTVRRTGHGLFEQARAIDETVGDLFPRTTCFVTGALTELNTATGRLRYLTAGHPPPLVVREGKVVRPWPTPTARCSG